MSDETRDLHEGCERRGGVCDCAGRPCALDSPPPRRSHRITVERNGKGWIEINTVVRETR